MLFKSRDEKRIFGIMNFQKKSRNGNEKGIFKRIWCFWKIRQVLVQNGRNSATTFSRKLTLIKFGCFSNLEMKKEYLE